MSDGYFFSFTKGEYVRRMRESRGQCVLCGIASRSADVVNLTVYRDDLACAAVNLYPYNPGHLLVFPVRHVEDLRACTAGEHERLAALTLYFMDILDSTYGPHGYNVGYNVGKAAGASLDHLHEHIIPRYPNEIGLADLVAGKRVLVEDPRTSLERMKKAVYERPFSISMT